MTRWPLCCLARPAGQRGDQPVHQLEEPRMTPFEIVLAVLALVIGIALVVSGRRSEKATR